MPRVRMCVRWGREVSASTGNQSGNTGVSQTGSEQVGRERKERGRGQNEEVVMGTENMQKNVEQEVAMLDGWVMP